MSGGQGHRVAVDSGHLVTAMETEEGRRWAESRLKALTGGDQISARFMRQDFFQFDPQFKLMIAGNHRPGLRSVDEAIRAQSCAVNAETTGRLAAGIQWFGFGAWKERAE